MEFQFGDVVMFMGRPHFIIGTNDNDNTLVVLDGDSTTLGVEYEDVVKIGHDDSFEQNVISRLNAIQQLREKESLTNQSQLIGYLKNVSFKNTNKEYVLTGYTKLDGKYLYCQVRCKNEYEWILMEELWDRFFK